MGDLDFLCDFKENVVDQYEKCKAYRVVCENENYNPIIDISNKNDIEKVPFLVTTVFKKSANLFFELLRISPDKLDKWTVSSSTSGDPSIVGRRNEDIRKLKELVALDNDMLDAYCDYNCVFYPTPEDMKNYRSVKIMDKPTESYIGNILGICEDVFEASKGNNVFLLKPYKDRFEVDIGAFENFIKKHDKKNHHLALRGSTILLYNAVQYLKKYMKPVELGTKALVHTGGGGWDGKKGSISTGSKMERWQFVEEVSEFLGIPQENFIDTYSFTENSFPITGHYSPKFKSYLFHIPKWGRVIIRDVKTLKPLHNPHDRGLLQMLNAYGTSSFAGASILVDDLAEIVSNNKCPECGKEGMVIKILGRVKGSEAKGCGATLNVGGDKHEN